MSQMPFCLAAGAWCLAAVVLANAYGSELISFLTVSELEPIINSLEELASNSSALKLLTEDNSPAVKILLVKNNKPKNESENSRLLCEAFINLPFRMLKMELIKCWET